MNGVLGNNIVIRYNIIDRKGRDWANYGGEEKWMFLLLLAKDAA